MAANKQIRIGPIALTTTLTTNILNPPTLTGGVTAGTSNTGTYYLLKHIRITNKTAGAATFSLWIGATGANAAGTEFMGVGTSIAANGSADFYGNVRLDTTDFLVGGSGTASALTIEAEGEIGIA
jgi:hypothetical protein